MEAEKIKNLEYEITQALEKLDSYESRKPKSTETGNEQILEKNLDQSSNLNVTNKKDPLRNFT
jgi:hypothetical protein